MRSKLETRLVLVTLGLASGWLGGPAHSQVRPGVQAEQICIVADERINESSGLARSNRHQDAVWIHNDSGDSARLFLVGMDGKTQGVFYLKDLPMPLDWEDMGSFMVDGKPWLVVGDIGDNAKNRQFVEPDEGLARACRLLFFPEPELKEGPDQDSVSVHTTVIFEYDDGPHNCESVAVDTERNEILLVTKSKASPLNCGLYTIPLTLEGGTIKAVARRIGRLNTPFATAMDISSDNRSLVLISSRGALVVERTADETWGEAIKGPLRFVALPERENGETVCFGSSNEEFLLNSEHAFQPLWRVTLP